MFSLGLLCLFLAALSASGRLSSAEDRVSFLVLGDWGGQTTDPYTTPAQLSVASEMGTTAQSLGTEFQIALGDNFYFFGVANDTDPRFKTTFEDVYTASSLMTEWNVVLGNHDYFGNASAQVQYTAKSNRWEMPEKYYSKVYHIGTSGATIQLVVIDTIILAGQTDHERPEVPPPGPPDVDQAEEQWTWIEDTLAASTATWLLVAGHYPIWSVGLHGPTYILVNRLKPMLETYQASAYLCGHDHDMQYIHEQGNDVHYYLSGSAHGCRGGMPHEEDGVPPNSLHCFYGPDDPNDEYGAYASFSVTAEQMEILYYDHTGALLCNGETIIQSNPRH